MADLPTSDRGQHSSYRMSYRILATSKSSKQGKIGLRFYRGGSTLLEGQGELVSYDSTQSSDHPPRLLDYLGFRPSHVVACFFVNITQLSTPSRGFTPRLSGHPLQLGPGILRGVQAGQKKSFSWWKPSRFRCQMVRSHAQTVELHRV